MSCCEIDNHLTRFFIDRDLDHLKIIMKDGTEHYISKAELQEWLGKPQVVTVETPAPTPAPQEDTPCLQKVKYVGLHNATEDDDILMATGGIITLPANIPVGKVITIVRDTSEPVGIEGVATTYPDGTLPQLRVRGSAVSAIRTPNGWSVVGDLALQGNDYINIEEPILTLGP